MCVCVCDHRQGVWMLLRTSRAPAAECLSLHHAGSETHSRQVNPPELRLYLHPPSSPPTASLPPPLPPRSHVPSVLIPPPPPPPLAWSIAHFASTRSALPFVSSQIINTSIPQTVHIHFLQQNVFMWLTECFFTGSSLGRTHVWHVNIQEANCTVTVWGYAWTKHFFFYFSVLSALCDGVVAHRSIQGNLDMRIETGAPFIPMKAAHWCMNSKRNWLLGWKSMKPMELAEQLKSSLALC